ncbi:hypothetical protein CH341_16935 [Rhodoplanes roseus]|uniref:Methyltransferase n=2 Tax=Rhodoplanes roseus TaxID=29409 RepID=A0A327KVS1_9BRAD|nr:hypothetical protein CH341_16935 [Rhodoplanes roseus]
MEGEALMDIELIHRGDVWRLGPHRLVCGDATVATVAAAALDGAAPLLMVTDPPYGVNYDPTWRSAVIDRATGTASKAGRALGLVTNDHRADWADAFRHFRGDVAYVWHGALNGTVVRAALEGVGFRPRAQIIWDKGRLILSRGHYHWRHEPCWYAVRKGRTAHWVGGRKQTTVWLIPHRRSETGHSAQKPIDCMRRPIENHSAPGDAVYDPFLGSGTTLVAAEMTGRACHAVELEPAYVAIALARWEDMTGLKAELLHREPPTC